MYKILHPKWSADFAYLCGLIVGDGSLPQGFSKRPNGNIQKRFEISFSSEHLEFLEAVYRPLFRRLFGITPYIVRWKGKNKGVIFYCRIESKELYRFLTNDIGMISGKKSHIAIPIDMPKKYKIHFLAGLLDTDGGKKGNGFGFSTASKGLSDFVRFMFTECKLEYHSCPWSFKGHTYHQIYLNKENSIRLLEIVPLRNKEKINFLECLDSSAW